MFVVELDENPIEGFFLDPIHGKTTYFYDGLSKVERTEASLEQYLKSVRELEVPVLLLPKEFILAERK